MKEPYYMAYEKRYQAVFSAGAKRQGHSPDDGVLYNTLKSWVEENHLQGKTIVEYACGEGACGEDFSEYIEAAKALGTKNIRIWAGTSGSNNVDEVTYKSLVTEAYRCAENAKEAGLTISFEYHRNTLTDTSESALRLMHELSHPNAYLYWQPNQNRNTDFNIEALKTVLPYVLNVHVFAWNVIDKKQFGIRSAIMPKLGKNTSTSFQHLTDLIIC